MNPEDTPERAFRDPDETMALLDEAGQRLDKGKRERDRYREALMRIVQYRTHPCKSETRAIFELQRIAAEALDPQP